MCYELHTTKVMRKILYIHIYEENHAIIGYYSSRKIISYNNF